MAAVNRSLLRGALSRSLRPGIIRTQSGEEARTGVSSSPPLSHHELGHLVAGQVQGKVLVGPFDGERVLLAQHAGALVGEALVAPAVAQLLGTAKRVTVRRVLTELRPLQAVLLIEPDVVEGLAVPVGRRLRLPARRRLRGRAASQILEKRLTASE